MRPQGVIRRALLEAAVRLYEQKGGATWPEIAAAAELPVAANDSIAGETVQRGIAERLAKTTVRDMVRAGELERIGSEKPAGSKQWHAVFAPVPVHVDETHDAEPSQRLSELLTEVHIFG